MEKVQVDALNRGMQILDAVAKKLDITSAHVYDVIVRQQYVEVGMSLLTFVVVATILWLLRKDILRGLKELVENDTDGFTKGMILAIFFCLIVVGYAFIGAVFGNNLGKLINPEFYAIEYIIDAVKAK